MPIYEYACKICEYSFDALQKMSEPVLLECPECGEASLKKLLSAPKFRLKGEGWYETDFKTGDKRNLAGDADGGKNGKDSKVTDDKATDSSSTDTSKAGKKDTKSAKKEPKPSSTTESA